MGVGGGGGALPHSDVNVVIPTVSAISILRAAALWISRSRITDTRNTFPCMIDKLLVAAFFIASIEALEINACISRRAAVAKVASLASLAAPVAACAELQQASDAEVYWRADQNKLNAARAIERAQYGDLVVGASATCTELDRLIAVDRKAVEYEAEKVQAIKEELQDGGASSKADKASVIKELKADLTKAKTAEDKLQAQVERLKKIRQQKECVSMKKPTDAAVYKRADEGTLTTSRVIERTKAGELVDGSSATCPELREIIDIDKAAISFEKDKIAALAEKTGTQSFAQVKIINARANVIDDQIGRLMGIQLEKGCR